MNLKNRIKTSLGLIFSCIVFTPISFADTILGVYVGANYWHYDLSGDIQVDQNSEADIDFDDGGNVFYAALEHPVPFLPNIKLQQNNIQTDGLISIDTIEVNSDLDFSHIDLTLYYEVLDNWLNLDLGLSFKHFDGYTDFYYQDLLDERSDFSELVPMLYAKGKFDLPFTGFSASASLQALSFNSNKATDVDLAINYESSIGLGASTGYRTLDIDIDDFTSNNVTIDGFYLGVNFHF